MKRLFILAAVTVGTLIGVGQASAQQYGQYGQYGGYNGTPEILDRWFRHYYGRPLDQAGVNYWAPRLGSQHPQEVLADLLATEEYYQRQGGDPHRYVLGLYRDVLGRTNLRPQDVDYWVNKMFQYGSREAMTREFLHDANINVFNVPSRPATPDYYPPYSPTIPRYTPPPAPGYYTPAPTYPTSKGRGWAKGRWWRD